MVKLRPHTAATYWSNCLHNHATKVCVIPIDRKRVCYIISLSIVLKRLREHKLAYEYTEGSSQKTIYLAFE